MIDDISIVRRFASETSNSIPVTSDEEALAKTIKEVVDVLAGYIFKCLPFLLTVTNGIYLCLCFLPFLFQLKNEKVHFIWTQFSELHSYLNKQAEDSDSLNKKIAEMIALHTCQKNHSKGKGPKSNTSAELKEVVARMDNRIHKLYKSLPTNAMMIVCTGHGDTAVVRR